ncbi:MAG: hypothetical protein ABI221_01945, partial [Candidatus Saccharimonadales bacterium]
MNSVRNTAAAALLLAGSFTAGQMIGPGLIPPDRCSAPTAADQDAVTRLFSTSPINVDGQRPSEDTEITLPERADIDSIDGADINETDFSFYYHKSKHFLGSLGVKLSVAKSDELTDGNKSVPSSKQLKTATAKYELREIVDGLSLLPTELIAYSGLKHVVLAANTSDYAYADSGTIVVDISNFFKGTDLGNHEISHLIDGKECGSNKAMVNDPSFRRLNRDPIYTHHAYAAGDEITKQEIASLNASLVSMAPSSSACKIKSMIDSEQPKVVASSAYGLTNITEDKAEIMKDFGFPS